MFVPALPLFHSPTSHGRDKLDTIINRCICYSSSVVDAVGVTGATAINSVDEGDGRCSSPSPIRYFNPHRTLLPRGAVVHGQVRRYVLELCAHGNRKHLGVNMSSWQRTALYRKNIQAHTWYLVVLIMAAVLMCTAPCAFNQGSILFFSEAHGRLWGAGTR